MSYTAVSDFKYGLDRRRPQSSGVPGTLWTLKNAVLTRGGDIERAKKFDSIYSLPTGTFGYFGVKGQKYVFGSASTPAGLPTGLRYQQLAAPNTPNMTEVLDAKGFDGVPYVIAAYDDGNIYHFHDGARVTDWDTLATDGSSFETVAERLAELIDAQTAYSAIAFGDTVEITAAVAGTAFTISAAATDNGTASTPSATATSQQANVAAVAEVRATGSVEITGGSASAGVNQITSVTVDGTELLASAVDFVSDNTATANALAIEINNNSGNHDYVASASGAIVTLKAAVGTGATPNGDVVASTTAGDVTTTDTNMASGVTAVAAVAQVYTVAISGSSFDADDLWTITLDGTAYKTTGKASATGTSLYVHKQRVYSPAGSLVRYCKLADATDWTDSTVSSGAGFINISNEVDGAVRVYALAAYNGNTAIFARDVTVIFALNADAETNSIVQVLGNTGTIAPRAVVPYGSDVDYLDETGIRSLRTRDVAAEAYASDVGSAIDPFVQDIFTEVGEYTRSKACAVIEPIDGRFMLAIGPYVVILSYFPSSKIVAWSYIDFEDDITDMIRVGRSVQIRSGDTIYAYGGASGSVYPDEDEFPILAETPFISAKDPASLKQLEGFDMAAENVWHIEILLDPNDPSGDRKVDAGYLDGTTYHLPAIKLIGESSHFAIRATCSAAGFASLSSTAVHSQRKRSE